MNVIKKILSILFWSLFIFLLIILSEILIIDIFPGFNKEILIYAFVAFFGAFFGFSFAKMAESTTNIRKRNIEHFNTTVNMEHILNKALFSLDKNICAIENYLNAIKERKSFVFSYHNIQFNDELLIGLKNIDFINELFSFFRDIETLNNDMRTFRNTYDEIKSLFFDGKITGEIYEWNISYCVELLAELLNFQNHFKEKAIRLFAISRLIGMEKKKKTFLFGPIPRKKYRKNFEELVNKEISKVKKEIQDVMKKSHEEIESIKKSINEEDVNTDCSS